MEKILTDLVLSPLWYFAVARGLLVIVVLMSISAYTVLLERKASAWIQGRIGPNRTNHPLIAWIPFVGTFLAKGGFIQPAADGLKFLFKEDALPGHVRKVYYVLAPIIALAPAIVTLVMLPFGQLPSGQIITLCPGADVGVLFMFAISSLGVYGIALAGWSANSKFPFLGAVRGAAQLISYELAMGLSVLTVFLATASPDENNALSLVSMVNAQNGAWNILFHPVAALVFLICIFAETNRHPFDMPESETDLVGGFHTEYGAFKFGIFFVAEYSHMIIGSSLFILMFLGGWHILPWMPTVGSGIFATLLGLGAFFFKLCFFLFFFVWVRWTIPRFRYDQVMRIGWRVLLPVAVLNLLAYFIWYAIRG
ncbi:MAG: NADH-quinone oxidoreductase subunit H [Verrucomicrobia bacterium]|nr:NADH-quinone oxidoreductase subunit H [Verrucomicrobiota bacterium]NBS05604.1 NADH-quinone oxidoreductase subunit H [Verrucomicrobiota bacterium]NBY37635.1 NADH-quinone oxidoreductase subunit H [Verrucomicrobiota bacterium]